MSPWLWIQDSRTEFGAKLWFAESLAEKTGWQRDEACVEGIRAAPVPQPRPPLHGLFI